LAPVPDKLSAEELGRSQVPLGRQHEIDCVAGGSHYMKKNAEALRSACGPDYRVTDAKLRRTSRQLLRSYAEKRLARILLLLANFGKEGKPEPLIAKIGQETLAEMIGTTRSRVSFFMNKFRKLGFIDYKRWVACPQFTAQRNFTRSGVP